MKGDKLNARQERFALLYFQLGNAGKAAIQAGYSPRTAQTIGCENIRKPLIRQRLQELQDAATSEKIMSVIERKERLSEIARARLTDYMELGQDGSWVNLGPETPNAAAIQEIHSRTEYDKDTAEPTIYTSVKLHDPIKAIAELNRMEHIYEPTPTVNIDNRQVVVENTTVYITPDMLQGALQVLLQTGVLQPDGTVVDGTAKMLPGESAYNNDGQG